MQNIQNITVYLGSSGRCRDIFKDTAREMGRLIGAHEKNLVYGGMDAGLMGIVANTALQNGAKVTGIIPKSLKDSERIHPNLSETILVADLWERKKKMFKRADAIINLPGGFGTLDEATEALYWADLGSHAKPIVFINTENYWDALLNYLRPLPDYRKEHVLIAQTPEEAFDMLARWLPPEMSGDESYLPHFEEDILQNTDEPLIFDTASIKQTYILATALGLKQLGKHDRHIGLLNDNRQFDAILQWIDRAKEEHFLTDRCKMLFDTATDEKTLRQKMDKQKMVRLNLHTEKWGPSETSTHIEIKETK